MPVAPSPATEDALLRNASAWYAEFFGRRVGGRGRDVAEDLAQEASIGFLRAMRSGGAETPEALRAVIGQRTWFGYLRREYRWRRIEDVRDLHEAPVADPTSSSRPDALKVGDPAERLRFQVLEFFMAHEARCLELARGFFSGLDWQSVAREAGASYAAVRKQWSRCVAALRDNVGRDEELRDSLWSFWGDEHA